MPDHENNPDPSPMQKSGALFDRLSHATALWAGRPTTTVMAFVVIMMWAASGPVFHFSDTWQLVINTATTIVTFLMVFLIQSSQNRDTTAIQIKLDELILRLNGAREELMDLEQLDAESLERIRREFEQRAVTARANGGSTPSTA